MLNLRPNAEGSAKRRINGREAVRKKVNFYPERDSRSLEGSLPTSYAIEIETLSSEQASVDRPCTRTKQRNTQRQNREDYVYPRLRRLRRIVERAPALFQYDERTCHRRPQTRQQKDAAEAGNQALREEDWVRGVCGKTGQPGTDQYSSETKPEQQQSGARRATWKS